jgi:hypothetical protein
MEETPLTARPRPNEKTGVVPSKRVLLLWTFITTSEKRGELSEHPTTKPPEQPYMSASFLEMSFSYHRQRQRFISAEKPEWPATRIQAELRATIQNAAKWRRTIFPHAQTKKRRSFERR